MASPSQLSEGLERNDGQEPHQTEEAKPKNYVFITKYKEWKREQKACQRERKVTVLEITNLESCGVMRPLFVRLVEEFCDVPFAKVLTGTEIGLSIDMVCVHYIATSLSLILFNMDKSV